MAFGDDGFASGSRGRGKRPGHGGGGNRKPNQKPHRPGGGGGGGFTDPLVDDPFDGGDIGSGNPFDTGTAGVGSNIDNLAGGVGSIFTPEGEQAAGDPDNYRGATWGLLNQAGMSQDPIFGGQQADWLEGQIDDWYNQWEGLGNIAGADRPSYAQHLYGIPGVNPPGPTLSRPGLPGGGGGAGGVDLDWVKNQWGPAMRQYASARYQSLTPRGRGTDMRSWVQPRRVVQF